MSEVLFDSEPLDGQPEYSFLGTDGQFYVISKTPHEFVRLLKKTGVNQKGFSFETLDLWIWLHLKGVPGQNHIAVEDVHRLYYQCDIPHIVDLIFQRLDDCKNSSNQALEVMASRLGRMQEAISATEEDGSLQQRREGREQPESEQAV